MDNLEFEQLIKNIHISLDSIFQLSLSEEQVKMEYSTHVLYHYCSLDSFFNIIKNKCFWLSHPKFMNDLSEYTYSRNLLMNFVDNYNEQNNKSSKLITKIKERLKNFESLTDDPDYNKLPFFCCFSKKNDCLPMWKFYGGDNVGISIGLEYNGYTAESNFFKKSKNSFLVPMRYDEQILKDVIDDLLTTIRDLHNDYLPKLDTEQLNKFEKEIVDVTSFHLIQASSLFKNINFSFEDEIRYLYYPQQKELEFRTKNKFIVPYVKYPSKETTTKGYKFPIKSITISPNTEEPKLVLASIKAYLRSKDYSIDEINFDESHIPYKPR